ncbi:hypothetical protein CAPTEDRAFT_175674 [Capitella teleta]|uniref:KASH domain-containing protein n=1 Tax=Capitella teleta TaxID=283909 RepID=R7TB20_CAPTE|nr:hypothetical protein CAPTEDRAFT_175674 [Capitella teleta]|eukprot:ELT88687.1 hypothetical protein CAPTEDRAFT_175674 [Capitella teleta]
MYRFLPRTSTDGSGDKASRVQQSLLELEDCWRKLESQVDDKQARLEAALRFQQLYQDTMVNVSSWLDDIEQRLCNTPMDRNIEQHLKENEVRSGELMQCTLHCAHHPQSLQMELASIQQELDHMTRSSQKLLAEAGEDSKDMINQSVLDLNDRVAHLEGRAKDQQDKISQRNVSWREFQVGIYGHHSVILISSSQDNVRGLQSKLAAARQQYASLATSLLPLGDQLKEAEVLEGLIKEYESQLQQLQGTGDAMMADDPSVTLPLELNALNAHWQDLHQLASEHKYTLDQAIAMQSQYERMLGEFTEYLETAQTKLDSDDLSAKDCAHLQEQHSAHKAFFANLESHRTLLEALQQKVDPATRQRLLATHTSLVNSSHVVQDKAAFRGQQLDRLCSQWTDFQAIYSDVNSWLERLKRQAPSQMRNTDALEEIRSKIWNFHSMQSALQERKADVFHVVDKGRQILQAVSCLLLDEELQGFSERWAQLNSEVDSSLKRLRSVLDQLEQFDRDMGTMDSWMEAAQNRTVSVVGVHERDSQNITALKSQMDAFLDFRKEVENQQPLKTKVVTLGNQLLHSRPNDFVIQDKLDSMEKRWMDLVKELPDNEEQLHKAQMELLPSRQALNEMLLWLEGIEATIREDSGMIPMSLMDAQVLLRKYRDLKIDMANRQLTIDFVNQSGSQVSQPELENVPALGSSVRAERAEFAERLGQMNKRYLSICSDVDDKLKRVEIQQMKWEEYEKGVSTLNNWFDNQESAFKKFQHTGHEASVEQAIKDCKDLENQLKEKETEIDAIKLLGTGLMDPHPPTSGDRPVTTTVNALNERWRGLDGQLYRVSANLEEALSQWKTYTAALSKVNQHLMDAEFALARYGTASGDLKNFKANIKKLQKLQSDIGASRRDVEKVSKAADALLGSCDPVAAQSLNKQVALLQAKWQEVYDALDDQVSSNEHLSIQWQDYEKEYERCRLWVEGKEEEVSLLIVEGTSSNDALQRTKDMKRDLENFAPKLTTLSQLSDQLTPCMDNATIIHITARESSLQQRLNTMQQSLNRQQKMLEEDLNRHARFDLAFKNVDQFLSQAEVILHTADPVSTADAADIRDRLEEFRVLSNKFTEKKSDLETVNLIGYRLSLGEADSQSMRQLNQKWYQLSSETSDRYKHMQSHLLLQQDFSQKCEEWMLFLAQVEKDLTAEVAGNYEALLEQQQAYEAFHQHLHTRQQILHSIIAEGTQMIANGDVEDKAGFERKLLLLDEQWRSVVNRAAQRKAILQSQVELWRRYNETLSQLKGKMNDVSESLASLEVRSAPLQRLKLMLNSCKTGQREVALSEPLYHKLHEMGKLLKPTVDSESRSRIASDLSSCEKQWLDIIASLDSRKESLRDILNLWDNTESGMEDSLAWLKGIRHEVTRDLPLTYDDLVMALQQCQEFENSFANAADKRGQLRQQHHQLRTCVSAEDTGILQQRLLLLDTQWQEILHQVHLRKQRVQERLGGWSAFSLRYKELLSTMSNLETKIASSKEVSIEDLLFKLQNDYREELRTMDRDRQWLCDEGERLKRASSDVRASDIEFKIARVEEKWSCLEEKAQLRLLKLQETLKTVQQLEHNMGKLRSWLVYVEHELTSPIVYQHCDFLEIQRKLTEQQEMQTDIERHSSGVASVLNLCEVLPHDTDACPTDVERRAIESAKASLEKRWRSICQLSMERRIQIEETWRQWEKFHADHQRLSDFLAEMDGLLVSPRTESATFDQLRAELRKFETHKRRLHESIKQLDSLNRHYRHLAREGRTDVAGELRQMVLTTNDFWDELSQRTATIMRRLKHTTNVVDDFRATREGLLIWLGGLQTQMADVSCNPGSYDVKLEQLRPIQHDLQQNSHRLEYIDKVSTYLMQKCEASDAVQIQREVEEFHVEVENAVSRLASLKESFELGEGSPQRKLPLKKKSKKKKKRTTTYRETSAAVQPLNWDEYGLDLDIDSSPETNANGQLKAQPDGQDRWRSDLRRQVAPKKERLIRLEAYLQELQHALGELLPHLDSSEQVLRAPTPLGAEAEGMNVKYVSYFQKVSACQDYVDTVQTLERRLREETGVSKVMSVDPQVKEVLDRWKVIETEALEKDQRLLRRQQQWTQLKADLRRLLAWLEEAEGVQSRQTTVPTEIRQLEAAVRRQREFTLQINNRKPVVLSVNLLCKELVALGTPESRDLWQRLSAMNQRWDKVCANADVWQKELQIAMMQCRDFTETVQDLMLWLEEKGAEIYALEPVDLQTSLSVLHGKCTKFKILKHELEAAQPRIASLQDTAVSLDDKGGELTAAKERLLLVASQHKSLLKICLTYLTRLNNTLEGGDLSTLRSMDESKRYKPPALSPRSATSPFSTRQVGESSFDIESDIGECSQRETRSLLMRRRRSRLVARVCCAALPFHMLMLLLLGVACLVPMTEDDYSCVLANNFRKSLDPMLRHTDGPPPF